MPHVADPSPHDSLAALRRPFVRAFMVGRMGAGFAQQFVAMAIGWELYEKTGDAFALGLVGAVQIAPAFALTIPAGVAADRFRRRDIGVAAHLLLALATAGLAIVSQANWPVAWAYALLAVMGVGRAFAMPATGTLLAQILTAREFANAYSWLVSTIQIASIAGPAVGGALIAGTNSAAPAYAIAALGQLIFVAALLTVPSVPPGGQSQRGLSQMVAGLTFIQRTPVFLAAITLDLFAVLLGGAIALLPVYAKDVLLLGPDGLGWLRTAPAVGAAVAALLTIRLPPWQRPGVVLLIAVGGFGVATVGFGLSRELWLSLLCLFLTGACDSFSMVIRGTLQQVITPDHLRGRTAAVNSLFIGLSNEMGAFRAGSVAALFGSAFAVVSGGIGTILVVVAAAFLWPQLLRIGALHTLRPAEEPSSESAEARPAARPAAG